MIASRNRALAWLAIAAGGLLAALAAGWLTITIVAGLYGLGEFGGRVDTGRIVREHLPILLVGGAPILVGVLLVRFGLRGLRPR